MKYDCLIIEDEKLLADSTAEYFNLFGVKTAVVYSAPECRDFLRRHTAQLLLLDIMLMCGKEAQQQNRYRQPPRAIP